MPICVNRVEMGFVMFKNKKVVALFLIGIFTFGLITGLVSGCSFLDPYISQSSEYPAEQPIDGEVKDISEDLLIVPLTRSPAVSTVLVPTASGTKVAKNDKAIIDYSNITDGYVMVKWLTKTTEQLRVQVAGPGSETYTYYIWPNDTYEVFPLSDGNGKYTVGVFEHVGGGRYARANNVDFRVTLKNEFAPFLHPNQYVNFTKDSKAVAKAAELVTGVSDLLDKTAAVYKFVIGNITYDTKLANDIVAGKHPGYLPDIDAVLASRKGICFDYAALMTAMLRSQNIPTKLVVGYADKVKHAWISVYSEKTGWINNVIFFDGKDWKMMDPTFAAAATSSKSLQAFIGDGNSYTMTHLY